MSAPRPWNLVAELTYRCPLRCVYCSNPEDWRGIADGLDAAAWNQVFREAAALGVVHVGLTGGEPSARADLETIVRGAAEAGLYTHLVTAGTFSRARLEALRAAGLRSVQLSLQDARAPEADAIAGAQAHARKLAFARQVRALGLPLHLNVVLHRRNLERVSELIALARELGARRLELANAQYYGWAWRNRRQLLPTRAALDAAAYAVREARLEGGPEILFVRPDYHSDRPKPCMGGWARTTLVVSPAGRVFPCHAANVLPALEFWSVPERSLKECWEKAPGMNAFRGEDWMQEPCRSCPERTRDFGGCRCQAFLLAGDAAATDPACALAPTHARVLEARVESEASSPLGEPSYRN